VRIRSSRRAEPGNCHTGSCAVFEKLAPPEVDIFILGLIDFRPGLLGHSISLFGGKPPDKQVNGFDFSCPPSVVRI
jgi:hypothetical protein